VFNVGTGRPVSIFQLAEMIRGDLGKGREPQILGKFREGDIRHCYADISRARKVLGYAPRIPLEQGVKDLIAWVREQKAVDMVDRAAGELEARGLTA
jgi:dTDP-L-rhamnose 4-epimerase